MTDRFEHASGLVKDAKRRLGEVKNSYEKSLMEKEVSIDLRIAIKNVLDNLRSALDYAARELRERYSPSSGSKGRVYFPIAAKGSDFRSLVGKNIPGLLKKLPDLLPVLESFQQFFSPSNSWLPDLATLSNENKHERLTPQTRTESERVVARSQAGTVIWNPSAVRFGSGVHIGGAPVDPKTQLPVPSPQQTISREIWVAFNFETITQPVLPFLNKCIAGVENILETLRSAAK